MPQLAQTQRTSADDAVDRFNTPEAAAKYYNAQTGTATHRREVRCFKSAMAGIERRSSVLDLPCGTGRLLPMLNGLGYHVTEADSSPHMVDLAQQYALEQGLDGELHEYCVSNALQTTWDDNTIDVVISNRLFHHFFESSVRRQALAELWRICKHRLIVSFFNSVCVDGMIWHGKAKLRGDSTSGRVPIRAAAFRADVEACGLRLVNLNGTRPLISKQYYAVIEA